MYFDHVKVKKPSLTKGKCEWRRERSAMLRILNFYFKNKKTRMFTNFTLLEFFRYQCDFFIVLIIVIIKNN